MNVVWKVILDDFGRMEVEVPVGAEFIHVGNQGGIICVWFRCSPLGKAEKRTLWVVATNEPFPNSSRYLGTAHLVGGALVYHVFEGTE